MLARAGPAHVLRSQQERVGRATVQGRGPQSLDHPREWLATQAQQGPRPAALSTGPYCPSAHL